MTQNIDIKKLPDEELVERFRHSHDNLYIGELFNRYNSLVYGLALKYVKEHNSAEDLVMIIFEDLIRALKKHPVKNFRSWMFTFSKNHCLQLLRKKGRITEKETRYKNDQLTMENTEEEHLNEESREQLLQLMEEEIDHLKKNQKKCLELFYLNDFSYAEIEEKTGFSYNEVKSHIQNGKRNLFKMMQNRQND